MCSSISSGLLVILVCCGILLVQARWVYVPDDVVDDDLSRGDIATSRTHHRDEFPFHSLADAPKYVVKDHKIVKNTAESQLSDDGPPDHTKWAQMARYIVHNAEFVAMGTISTIPQVAGFPFVNVLSTADGPRGRGPGRSTGTPYFFTTELDFSAKDLAKDNRLTAMMSLSQQGYCQKKGLDAEDPRCARIMLSGKLVRVRNDTKEYKFAYDSLAERHPIMKTWPADHNFFLAKLKIANIAVLDWFGGPKYVPLDVYYNTDPYGFTEGKKEFELKSADGATSFFNEEENQIKYEDEDDAAEWVSDDRRYVSMMG